MENAEENGNDESVGNEDGEEETDEANHSGSSPKRKSYSISKKIAIASQYQANIYGKGFAAIAKMHGIDTRTLRRWWKDLDKMKKQISNRSKSIRKMKRLPGGGRISKHPKSDQHDMEEESPPASAADFFTFSKQPNLEDLRLLQQEFANERNWEQYHQPRNLVLALMGEVGELAEIFQWKGEVPVGLPGWKDSEKEHLAEEMSDVLCYLIRLADKCGIDLPAAAQKKIEKNRTKYPAPLVWGDSRKYNEYDREPKS